MVHWRWWERCLHVVFDCAGGINYTGRVAIKRPIDVTVADVTTAFTSYSRISIVAVPIVATASADASVNITVGAIDNVLVVDLVICT
jgi:hypothetical protein